MTVNNSTAPMEPADDTSSSLTFQLYSGIAQMANTWELAASAHDSCRSLCDFVAGLQSRQKIIRELVQELETLHGALNFLQQATTNGTTDRTQLDTPLLHCGIACNDFHECISKYSSTRTDGPTTDYGGLTYMGNNITKFRYMLEAYKSTIVIALCVKNWYVFGPNLL
jgi:Fungal N-terminal domain of STAND proteins